MPILTMSVKRPPRAGAIAPERTPSLKRDMQHRALLRDIDALALEHGVAARLDAPRGGELQEKGHRFACRLRLREIEDEILVSEAERLEALRVGVEERA